MNEKQLKHKLNKPINESQLKRKFNKQIKRYRSFCNTHGYTSHDEITLLWFFNRQGKARRNGQSGQQDKSNQQNRGGQYLITYQGIDYDVGLLITIFKNGG